MRPGTLADLFSNPAVVLDASVLTSIIKDVVAGMAFLHTLSPPILHGNLSARSVHLDASFQVGTKPCIRIFTLLAPRASRLITQGSL